MGMGTLPIAHKLSLTSPFLPRHRRPCHPAHRRRRRHGAVVAYMEPDPNSPGAIAGRLIGALPVVGLVARILSDEGGVGGDIIDFAEFRRRVSKKCTVMDSQAFYDFNDRRGKAGDPFYVLLCCWLAAVGGGLLKTEEILEGVARLRLSNDIEFEEETFIDMMKTAKEIYPPLLRTVGRGCKIVNEEDARLRQAFSPREEVQGRQSKTSRTLSSTSTTLSRVHETNKHTVQTSASRSSLVASSTTAPTMIAAPAVVSDTLSHCRAPLARSLAIELEQEEEGKAYDNSPPPVLTSSESRLQGNTKGTDLNIQPEINANDFIPHIIAQRENQIVVETNESHEVKESSVEKADINSLATESDIINNLHESCDNLIDLPTGLSAPCDEIIDLPAVLSDSCDKLIAYNDHVELVRHKEVLTRISPANSLCYIMLDLPMKLSHAMTKVSEIACSKSLSSAYTPGYKFNLIGDYSVDNQFLVYRICITCDHMDELKLAVLDNNSCVLNLVQYERKIKLSAHPMPMCSPFVAPSSMDNLNKDVELWKNLQIFSPLLDEFAIAQLKSDYMNDLMLAQSSLIFKAFSISLPPAIANILQKDENALLQVLKLFWPLEDGHESRTTQMQEREDDEDINPPDTTATLPPTRLLDCHRFGCVKRYSNVPINLLHLYLVLRHLTLGRGPCICINYLAQRAATILGYLGRPPPPGAGALFT